MKIVKRVLLILSIISAVLLISYLLIVNNNDKDYVEPTTKNEIISKYELFLSDNNDLLLSKGVPQSFLDNPFYSSYSDTDVFVIINVEDGFITISVNFDDEDNVTYSVHKIKDEEASIRKNGVLRVKSTRDDNSSSYSYTSMSKVIQAKLFTNKLQQYNSEIKFGSGIVGYIYYNETKDLSRTAAIMGNSEREGNLGQWQMASKDSKTGSRIDLSQCTVWVDKNGYPYVYTYAEKYSGKCADDMEDYSLYELKSDLISLSEQRNDNGKLNNVIGFGPTQATFGTKLSVYVDAINEFMETEDLDDIALSMIQVDETHLIIMENYYINRVFHDGLFDNQSNALDYMANNGITVENVMQLDYTNTFNNFAIKYSNNELESIIQETLCIIGNYERYRNYHSNITSAYKRSIEACHAYEALVESGAID